MPNLPNVEQAYTELDSLQVVVTSCHFEEFTALSTPRGLLALDYRKIQTREQELEILLHEIGHFSTATFYQWDTPYTIRQKQENKATRFIFEKYYPPAAIAHAFKQGHTELWQLAEYLSLPTPFVTEMLSFYKEVRGINFQQMVESLSPLQDSPQNSPLPQNSRPAPAPEKQESQTAPLSPIPDPNFDSFPPYLLALEEELKAISAEIDTKNEQYADTLSRYKDYQHTSSQNK